MKDLAGAVERHSHGAVGMSEAMYNSQYSENEQRGDLDGVDREVGTVEAWTPLYALYAIPKAAIIATSAMKTGPGVPELITFGKKMPTM